MPCDPEHLYVYWSLTIDDRKAIQQVSAGAEPWIRLLNINDQVIRSEHVDISQGGIYLNIQPTRVFRVQLTMKETSFSHRVLLTSKRLRPIPVYVEPMVMLETWEPIQGLPTIESGTPGMDIYHTDLPTSSGTFPESLED